MILPEPGQEAEEAADEPGKEEGQDKQRTQEEPIPDVVEVERPGGSSPACIPSNALGELCEAAIYSMPRWECHGMDGWLGASLAAFGF